MRTILSRLPAWVKTPLLGARNAIAALPYYGKGRYCPVCGKSSRRFRPFGLVRREEAQCVHCGALERHRLVWIFLQQHTDLFDGRPKTMLHVAPERCFEPMLKARLGTNYLTADLSDRRAMVQMDICDIQYPDASFDAIYCSHVLEHVLDDKQAMRELFRVLKRGRWAILNVPITSDTTFEDRSIVDPKERLKAFGQKDHVRRYGPDYVDRLREAGFTVEVRGVADLLNSDEAARVGLTHARGEVYYCVK